MDRAALDHAYSARDTVPDLTVFLKRYAALSAVDRQMPGARQAVAHGSHPTEVLDIFPADEGAPVFVYPHRFFCRMLGRGDSSLMAMALRANGVATVPVDYELVPAASMDRMVQQVRRAAAWPPAGSMTWRALLWRGAGLAAAAPCPGQS